MQHRACETGGRSSGVGHDKKCCKQAVGRLLNQADLNAPDPGIVWKVTEDQKVLQVPLTFSRAQAHEAMLKAAPRDRVTQEGSMISMLLNIRF